MASKNIIYKVTEIPTIEKIKEYKNKGYFFRFQNPYYKLTSRSKSWGMIYSSAREAEKDGSTVLNGKSCVKDVTDLIEYVDRFGNDDVVLVFKGQEQQETGHDGEIVATYYKKIAVWKYEDFCNIIDLIKKETERMRQERYNNTEEKFRMFLNLKSIKL